MKHSAEIERYVSDPLKLIDILDGVLKKLALKKPLETQAQKSIQFSEISKTTDRLKEAGIEIPDDLRRLKIELSHEAAEYETATAAYQKTFLVLKEMEIRLGNSLTEVRASLARMTGSDNSKPRSRRYVKRTSPSILAREIRRGLREIGGSGRKSEVLHRMKLNMNGKFKPQDLERDSQGNLNWEKWAVAEKMKMTKAGVIKVGAGFGTWELRKK